MNVKRVNYVWTLNIPAFWFIFHIFSFLPFFLDTGLPTNLSGWDTAPTSNQQIIIQTLDEYISGVRCGKCRELFGKRSLTALQESVFSPATGPQESKERLEKPWIYWEQHSSDVLSTLSIEGAPVNKKVNQPPPFQKKDFQSRHSFWSSQQVTVIFSIFFSIPLFDYDYQR